MADKVTPKNPQQEWLEGYFLPGLLAAKAYKIDTPEVSVKLDQNESPWDWPDHLKQKILQKVAEREWNRYPESMGDELHRLLGEYVGVPQNCLLTSPGSNVLIPLILDAMGRNTPGKVVIARPSFALFEMHCNYAGIKFETWDMDEDFSFDLNKLPELPKGSLVVFASPNNPTGTSLGINQLKELLESNPDTLFLADEAYYEFNDEPYIELLKDHSNMMILRTMSKTMGAAGVRLGYLIGAEPLMTELKKLRLPYMLNHFSMEAAKVILSDDEMQDFVKKNVSNAIAERERLYEALQVIGTKQDFRVIPSKANFLLVQWSSQEKCEAAYRGLIAKGILVRNISKGPGLAGCLRISIGTLEENDQLLSAIKV